LFIGFFVYLVTGATNNGGEDSTGCVISGETGLAHSGSIVNDKSCGVFVTHLERGVRLENKRETVTINGGLGSEAKTT
jgi:hypothetical protein